MTTKQTAVDWFYDKLENHEMQAKHYDLFKQAKAMEKEQIMGAYLELMFDEYGYEVAPQGWIDNAEQYYNETYGKI